MSGPESIREPGPGVRLVPPDVGDADIERAILAVAASAQGCPRRELWVAVVEALRTLRPGAPPPAPDRVLQALGMLIVRGDVDEAEGRVMQTDVRARRAG